MSEPRPKIRIAHEEQPDCDRIAAAIQVCANKHHSSGSDIIRIQTTMEMMNSAVAAQ